MDGQLSGREGEVNAARGGVREGDGMPRRVFESSYHASHLGCFVYAVQEKLNSNRRGAAVIIRADFVTRRQEARQDAVVGEVHYRNSRQEKHVFQLLS